MINKHKSNKIKENSNTVRHLNNETDHRHSKSCCDQSSPARRTIRLISRKNTTRSSISVKGLTPITLQWRHNGRDSISNHQPYDCLLNRLFRRRWKKTSKLRVTGLCAGNSPGTGEFHAQMASNAENISIWWRHHDFIKCINVRYKYI